MTGDIELFEAIVRRSATSVLHAPLFRLDGGALRRVSTGEVETGHIASLEAMSPWREAMMMPKARAVL